MYMVTSGQHFNGECCFDYGNAENDGIDTGKGSMEALYFGNKSAPDHGNASWTGGVGRGFRAAWRFKLDEAQRRAALRHG